MANADNAREYRKHMHQFDDGYAAVATVGYVNMKLQIHTTKAKPRHAVGL